MGALSHNQLRAHFWNKLVVGFDSVIAHAPTHPPTSEKVAVNPASEMNLERLALLWGT